MIDNLTSSSYDVAIIGGGPAGSTAAYYLSNAGKSVILFEKQSLPRYKTCGGGVVFLVNLILPYGFQNISEKICYSAKFYDHKAKVNFYARRDEPLITMVMRSRFDMYLLKKAEEKGTTVMDESEVHDIIISKDHIEVIAKNIRVDSKYVVAADGASGLASKKIGNTKKITYLPALESEIYLRNDLFEKFKLAARFDFDIIPNGYGWVFPKSEHLSVGVVRMKSGNVNLNIMLNKYIEKLGIYDIDKFEKHGFFIPLNNGINMIAKNGIMLTGDAAALADPVTGEGISSAILSGKLAAEAILKYFNERNSAVRQYNKIIKQQIIKEHKYAKIISVLIYSFPNVRAFLLRNYGQHLVELMTDVIMGKKKYSEMLTSMSNYFKLIKYFFKNLKINKEIKQRLA